MTILLCKHGGLVQLESVPKSQSTTWMMLVLKYCTSGEAVLGCTNGLHCFEGQSHQIKMGREELSSRGRKVPIIDVDGNHGGPCFGLFPSFAPAGTGNDNVYFERYFANVSLCTKIKDKR